MSLFQYEALTAGGRLMRGTLEAGGTEEARAQLKGMGLDVQRLERAAEPVSGRRLSAEDFLLFNQQLAALAEGRIPLERGLRELASDVTRPALRTLIEQIAGELEAGAALDEVIQRHRAQFPPLYHRLLQAGIRSGRLSEVLANLTRHLERVHQTRRIVQEAVAYPSVILVMAAVIVSVIFLAIVPQLASPLADMTGPTLPPPTRLALWCSRHVWHFWLLCGLVAGVLAVGWAALGRTAAGRRWREGLVHRLAVAGSLVYAGRVGRFAETMAVLVHGGCDLPEAFRLAGRSCGSERLSREADLLAEQLEQGLPLAEAGQWCRDIPKLFVYSLQLGLQRRELVESLRGLADLYREQENFYQARLQAVLLPGLILFVGSWVALAVLAIFLPLLGVVHALGGG